MAEDRILVADNDAASTAALAEFLRANNLDVTTASSPGEVRNLIDGQPISLAIIGIRLMDDDDVNDRSGLSLAEEFSSQVPIIIFSAHGNRAMVRKALGSRVTETRIAVDFTHKSEGFDVLLESIKRTLAEQQQKRKPFEEEVVAFAVFGKKIRLVSITPDGDYSFLDEAQNVHKILYLTTSVTLVLRSLVDELETLVNDPRASEKEFQEFFERNPNFILNDDHKKAHPHVVLSREDGEQLIPDFVLEPIAGNSLSDLLELKLPSAQVFVLQKRRMRFSAAVSEACAQLREYSAFFDEEKNRKLVHERYGLLAYRPKMMVIIGRRGTVNPIDVRKIEQGLPDLYLRTYDDVIDRMKAKVEAMKKGRII